MVIFSYQPEGVSAKDGGETQQVGVHADWEELRRWSSRSVMVSGCGFQHRTDEWAGQNPFDTPFSAT